MLLFGYFILQQAWYTVGLIVTWKEAVCWEESGSLMQQQVLK